MSCHTQRVNFLSLLLRAFDPAHPATTAAELADTSARAISSLIGLPQVGGNVPNRAGCH